jgi:hypothetical protein
VLSRLLTVVILAGSLQGCIRYEYEHEIWLRVDGSGTVYVTGRPELWAAFKGLAVVSASDEALRDRARDLFTTSGLRVRRVTVTHRGGRPYLFVAADFDDVDVFGATRAFPDLRLSLIRKPEALVLDGVWAMPPGRAPRVEDETGLVAVRFHLPSRIFDHRNAVRGVERGNILSWSESLQAALAGRSMGVGATLGSRSILWSTVVLFAAATIAALSILAGTLWLVTRHGRRIR